MLAENNSAAVKYKRHFGMSRGQLHQITIGSLGREGGDGVLAVSDQPLSMAMSGIDPEAAVQARFIDLTLDYVGKHPPAG